MYLKYSLPAFKVRQLHLYPPVESARTEQRLVKALRTVRSGQDHDTFSGVEPVHLGKKLVESLFPLIISSAESIVPLLSYGIDLIDEDDARSFL